ncbi:response regulator [Legionella dresdenensis]|uniref:Response regulator n=1 Tax=Legionella dresdenensis TaxID=450200 RepID=A0ABV8CDF6_9GAMM
MQYFSIPACYFPSTALFIDDNRDFLLNFVLQLDEGLAYRIFDSPFDALDFIHKKNLEISTLGQRCHNYYNENNQNNFAAICNEMYNKRRFAEISVVVVDYAMPGMDGLEFCRRLSNSNIKKILLTGKAEEKLAVEAFNEGLIQRYIHKSDPEAAELITQSIYDLQWQYFQNMSNSLVRRLSLHLSDNLLDRTFAGFFRDFCRQKMIIEHYVSDEDGNYFLLDNDAKASTLIVKHKTRLESDAELAASRGASQDVINQIRNGEKILYRSRLDEQNLPLPLITGHQVAPQSDYLYAHIQGIAPAFDKNRISSYYAYLDEIDAEELLLL